MPFKTSLIERLTLPFKMIYWRWFWKIPDVLESDEASACWTCDFCGRDKLKCADCNAPDYRNYRASGPS